MDEIIKAIEAPLNPNVPTDLRIGDNISVFLRIKEGSNERVQEFKGILIRMGNAGINRNFTVRRVASNGIGVERTFMLRSPRIERVQVHRHSHVRRSKLYFLRDRTGKSARLKQKFN
ncbi:MAG TPA: 50S ribosomal protein L19 [Chloroflexi bacterium]|nr:50S ribosomal protein L19 [Chloroflexota bacterium]HBY07281.1 50S ribosomal protein L19 [Chloroflexota bacterium]